jgi:transcriptional regulator with XRE-family HTH domain
MSEAARKIEAPKVRRIGVPTKSVGVGTPRKVLKMTQEEVAERMGATQGQVSKIEAADDAIQVSTLRAYAEAIGCTLEVCMTRDGLRVRVL